LPPIVRQERLLVRQSAAPFGQAFDVIGCGSLARDNLLALVVKLLCRSSQQGCDFRFAMPAERGLNLLIKGHTPLQEFVHDSPLARPPLEIRLVIGACCAKQGAASANQPIGPALEFQSKSSST
jgi:hypothetical protein